MGGVNLTKDFANVCHRVLVYCPTVALDGCRFAFGNAVISWTPELPFCCMPSPGLMGLNSSLQVQGHDGLTFCPTWLRCGQSLETA